MSKYRFAQQREAYTDLAGGRVLYSLPGYPALPVRLASEVFQRCADRRRAIGGAPPWRLYDPCCGGAYHLTALGFLHGDQIAALLASDIDPQAVTLAQRNLSLLQPEGLAQRADELAEMAARFGKDSHRQALGSARTLQGQLAMAGDTPIATHVFQADATDPQAMGSGLGGRPLDIVLADVPYGWSTAWQASSGPDAPEALGAMLTALLHVAPPTTIVAIISDKGQRAAHAGYRRLESMRLGRRIAVLLQPVGA